MGRELRRWINPVDRIRCVRGLDLLMRQAVRSKRMAVSI